jgi:hypothetical protein
LVLGPPFGIVGIPDKANRVEQFHTVVRQIVMLALIASKEFLTGCIVENEPIVGLVDVYLKLV